MAFTQVRRQKAYIQIADQIMESIRRGEFGPGDRLPSARELETKFGVSRPTVREAMSALELAGAVETRMGQGSFVARLPSPAERSRFEFDQGESPAEILEVRLVLEPEGARLAAKRAADNDIDELTAILTTLRAVIGEGRPAISSDIQFHIGVARASRNSVIHDLIRGVADYSNQDLWRSLRIHAWERKDLGRVYLQHHERTLEAIKARDSRAAARAMRDHLRHVEQDLFTE